LAEVTMLNPDNPKHAAADLRLRHEAVIWLTTVSEVGQPEVGLHLDGNGEGGGIVIRT
jgi:hypothetical protein